MNKWHGGWICPCGRGHTYYLADDSIPVSGSPKLMYDNAQNRERIALALRELVTRIVGDCSNAPCYEGWYEDEIQAVATAIYPDEEAR